MVCGFLAQLGQFCRSRRVALRSLQERHRVKNEQATAESFVHLNSVSLIKPLGGVVVRSGGRECLTHIVEPRCAEVADSHSRATVYDRRSPSHFLQWKHRPACQLLRMQLLEGGDVRHALSGSRGGEFAWYGHGRSIALDVARGLHFLHSSGVIHRGETQGFSLCCLLLSPLHFCKLCALANPSCSACGPVGCGRTQVPLPCAPAFRQVVVVSRS